jgi:hypothetical protein
MNKSDSIGNLTTALIAAQSRFTSVKFNKINPHFKRGYADLTAIIETTRPALIENGLAVMQFPSADGAAVHVETVLSHKSGEWVSGTTTVTASKPDAQGVGAAITYAKRYGLAAILCISAEEDDDGNDASAPPPGQRQAARQDPKPATETPKARFAGLVKGWSGCAPEDLRAACLEVAKFAKIDLATATDAQFETLCAGVKSRMESGMTFADFVKEPR